MGESSFDVVGGYACVGVGFRSHATDAITAIGIAILIFFLIPSGFGTIEPDVVIGAGKSLVKALFVATFSDSKLRIGVVLSRAGGSKAMYMQLDNRNG